MNLLQSPCESLPCDSSKNATLCTIKMTMNVLVSKYLHERVNIDKRMKLFLEKKGKNIKLNHPVIEPQR